MTRPVPRGSVPAANVVWVFGSGRTGSSWLTSMMGELPRHWRWNEPLVGHLFGHLYCERAPHRRDTRSFILSDHHNEVWRRSVRSLVLDGAIARFPKAAGSGYVVIKEPHGSIGAPLLMDALPESRMIFLVRDPRDAVASALNVAWVDARNVDRSKRRAAVSQDPDRYVRRRARSYMRDIEVVRTAYQAHAGRKTLVRYEDLRAEPLETMERIYSDLEIEVMTSSLEAAVEKHLWENIPDDAKGTAKIRRRGTPGGWREDLTPRQAEIVAAEAAQVLEWFYRGDGRPPSGE